MPNKLRIIKNNKLIVTIKFQYPNQKHHNPFKDGLDLMVDAGNRKKKYFDMACISTPTGIKQCQAKINSISWHGFFYKDNKEIKFPIIRFKEDGILKCHTRFTDTISLERIIMFPICSFYIPQDISKYNFSNYTNINNEFIIELTQDISARVDVFVLPQSISFEKYINNFTHSSLEIISDISLYDQSLNCAINSLPIESDNHLEIKNFVINNYTVIIRTIYTETTRERKIINGYSVLFHDPNNVINKVLNRRILYPDPKSLMPDYKLLMDIYKKEINNNT
jgi:hypothetical protein